jgi:hypothetical protein
LNFKNRVVSVDRERGVVTYGPTPALRGFFKRDRIAEPAPTACDKVRDNAVDIMFPLGRDKRTLCPVGIPFASAEHVQAIYLRDTLRWPVTWWSLLAAQERSRLQDQAASERLWTEENA